MADLPYGGSGLPYNGGKEPYTPRKKKKAEGGALMDPVLPIPDRLPNWGDVSKAVDVAKSFLTPTDPYEAAGKAVTQAKSGDYLGALETGLSFMPQTGALYQRKLSPQGFYSHGAESAYNLPQETMTVQQARKMLEKAGTKPDEFRWSGFDTAFADPMAKVNRADLVRHFEENAPQLGETVLGHDPRVSGLDAQIAGLQDQFDAMPFIVRNRRSGNVSEPFPTHEAAQEYIAGMPESLRPHLTSYRQPSFELSTLAGNFDRLTNLRRQIQEDTRPSKFEQYTLPGGENYREVLTTLPQKPEYNVTQNKHGEWQAVDPINNNRHILDASNYEDALREAEARIRAVAPGAYRSSHWDEPNVLAHLRMSERPGNVLHLEELQSDWGQEARRKGIAQPENPQRFAELNAQLQTARERLAEENRATANAVLGGDYRDFIRRTPNPDDRAPALEALRQYRDSYGGPYNSLNAEVDRLNQELMSHNNVGKVPDAPYISSTQGWTDLGLKRALYEAARANAERLAWTPGAEQAARYDLSKQLSEIVYNPNTGYFSARDLEGGMVNPGKTLKPEELPSYIGKEGADRLLSQEPNGAGIHVLRGGDLSFGGEGMKGYYDKILPSRLQALLKRLGVGSPEITPLPVGDKEIPSMAITPEMRERLLKGLPYFASGGEVSAPITGEHTITMDDLIGRAPAPASTPGAYTDTGGQKIAAPYVLGMANGYPVYSIPQSGDTAISDALDVARHVGRHKTGTPVYSLAGA